MAFDPGSWWNSYRNIETFGGAGSKKNSFNNPADAARPYLDQIPGLAQQTYNPYIQQGQGADKALGEQYGNLMNNPGDVYNKLGAGYQQSPGFQYKLQQALAGSNNAQAAGGMLGSPQHQMLNSGIANDVAGKDYEDYMNHIMGLYGAGLGGEQGFSNRGWDASQKYGDTMMNNLQNQANLAFRSQGMQNDWDQQEKENQNKWLGALLKLGGAGVGAYFGGPAGATAGANAADMFSGGK